MTSGVTHPPPPPPPLPILKILDLYTTISESSISMVLNVDAHIFSWKLHDDKILNVESLGFSVYSPVFECMAHYTIYGHAL